MKKYENLDTIRRRSHVVEVNVQQGEYKGRLNIKVGGNCFGLDVLNIVDKDMIYDIHNWECIGCSFELLGEDDNGEVWFKYELTSDSGEECTGETYCRDFSNMIVGIKITECAISDE